MVHERSNLEGEKWLLLVRLYPDDTRPLPNRFCGLRLYRDDVAVSTRFHAWTCA